MCRYCAQFHAVCPSAWLSRAVQVPDPTQRWPENTFTAMCFTRGIRRSELVVAHSRMEVLPYKSKKRLETDEVLHTAQIVAVRFNHLFEARPAHACCPRCLSLLMQG